MGRTLNITEEERNLLTPEELAGLEEGENFDEGEGADSENDKDDADDKGGDDDKSDDKGGDTGSDDDKSDDKVDDDKAGDAAAAADDAGTGDAGTGDDGADQGDDEVEGVTKLVNFGEITLPSDYDDKVKSVADRKAELSTKFDEGDLTTAEYHKQYDEIQKEERDLERLKDRVEDNNRNRYAHWVNVDVAQFVEKYPEYKNPRMSQLLDAEVRKLQVDASIDTDPALLVKAHKAIVADMPDLFKSRPAAKKDDKPAAKPAAQKASVPVLAKTPAAEIDNPGENEFDWLDRLSTTDPLRYERELEKLSRTSPAKYDDYMASQ